MVYIWCIHVHNYIIITLDSTVLVLADYEPARAHRPLADYEPARAHRPLADYEPAKAHRPLADQDPRPLYPLAHGIHGHSLVDVKHERMQSQTSSGHTCFWQT